MVDNPIPFRLEGKEKENDWIIECRNCYLSSTKGNFSCREIWINRSNYTYELNRKTIVESQITNVDETFRVFVDIDLGPLRLLQVRGKKEIIKRIKRTGETAITSSCRIRIDNPKNSTIQDIFITSRKKYFQNFF